MSDGTSARDAYLAELRAQREKIDKAIALIEEMGGPGGGGGGSVPTPASNSSGDLPAVGRHEFVGLNTPEATKRYLRKIGQRLASPREIASQLIAGGQSTQDAEMVYQNVYSALKRMRGNGEVVKQGQEWGLAEVFPALVKKAPKPAENGTKPSKGDGDAADKTAGSDVTTAA